MLLEYWAVTNPSVSIASTAPAPARRRQGSAGPAITDAEPDAGGPVIDPAHAALNSGARFAGQAH